MGIATILANVSCSDLAASEPWYAKLFGKEATRHPMAGLAEWHFTDSAGVQLYEQKDNAGHCTVTLGVLPLEPERKRLLQAGLTPGPIEEAKDLFIMRIRDPDNNLVVLASVQKDA